MSWTHTVLLQPCAQCGASQISAPVNLAYRRDDSSWDVLCATCGHLNNVFYPEGRPGVMRALEPAVKPELLAE